MILKEKLFLAVSLGDKTTLNDLLKWTNVDFNDSDPQGNTPLNFAVQVGNLEFVKLLILHGADFNKPNNQGNTPLHYAFSYGFLDIFDTLIEAGANQKSLNNNGKNPWQGIK